MSRRSFTSGRILEAVESASRHTQRVVLPEVDGLSKIYIRCATSIPLTVPQLPFLSSFILLEADLTRCFRPMFQQLFVVCVLRHLLQRSSIPYLCSGYGLPTFKNFYDTARCLAAVNVTRQAGTGKRGRCCQITQYVVRDVREIACLQTPASQCPNSLLNCCLWTRIWKSVYLTGAVCIFISWPGGCRPRRRVSRQQPTVTC